MNPINTWERLKNKEIMEGGNPMICIMGCDDYATFCGAVAVVNGLELFGHKREVIYNGVRLFCSRANRRGIMFA